MKTPKEHLIKRQIEHIRLVQDSGIFLELNKDKLPFEIEDFEILNRALCHDLDKFKKGKTRDGYMALAEYHENRMNDIPNKVKPEDLEYGCEIHYKTQDHHMAYYFDKKVEPSNVAICEMCCDILACANRHNGNVDSAIEYFLKNFNDEFSKKNKEIFIKIFELLREKENEN